MMHTNYKQFVYTLLFLTSFSQVYSQSFQELQKMKAEYEKFQKGQSQIQMPTDVGQQIDPQTGLPKLAEITPYQFQIEGIDSLDTGLKHFGYDFFTRRDTIKFWENLPTPANYLLGTGDEIVISLWGETQLRETYIISRDGKIYDEKVGLLYLTGKTIEDGKKYLIEQFSRIYATLKGINPSTFMDISLGQLRSINVNFVGEVTYPGVYPVHPFSTVITGLIQAGGVDTSGSLRNIEIKRDGENHSIIDLYDYLLKGDLPKNIQLRDQDVVIVPVRSSTVAVDSAVVRPGYYESKPGETVRQMITYAGGLKPHASSSIGLKRIIPLDKRKAALSNIENYYIDYFNSQLTRTQNGDLIIVRSMFKTLNQVEIIGQVKNPGIYHFSSGMTLKDLVELGGGLKDATFRKSVYQARGELVRRNPNSRYETIIEINLNNIINNDSSSNMELQNLDYFVIHANRNFFDRKNVQVLGEVNIPGSYSLLNDSETLEALIDRAGGLSSKALDNGISIYREKIYFEDPPVDKVLTQLKIQGQGNIENVFPYQRDIQEEKDENMIKLAWRGLGVTLMPGDSIIINPEVGAVFVTGEVYNPGLVEFQSGKSVRYYINSAGGINNYGDRANVVVVYPNGITVPWGRFWSPRIIDGSTVVVYQKADLTPFDATGFASNMSSLITSLVTIILLTQQL